MPSRYRKRYRSSKKSYYKRSAKSYAKRSAKKRTYRRKTKKIRSKRFNRRVKSAVLKTIAVKDEYAFNIGQRWDCAAGTQMFGVNLNSNVTIASLVGDPSNLLSVRNWVSPFFSNGVDKFFVQKETIDYIFKNQGNAQCYLDLYVWRCTRDLPKTADWTNLYTFFQYGLTNTGNTVTMTNVGVTPFINPLWCKYFHCIKKKRLNMDAFKDYKMRFKSRRPYSYDYLLDGKSAQQLAYRNRTTVLLPILIGPLEHDSTNKYTEITTGKAAVDVIHTHRFKIAVIENAAHDTTFLNSLTVPTVGATSTVYGSNYATFSVPNVT